MTGASQKARADEGPEPESSPAGCARPAVDSDAPERPPPATYGPLQAAFFDLDKTVIAKASMVAFGRPHWLAVGSILRGSAYSASGDRFKGVSCIENGIRDYCATGAVLGLPFFLGIKAEALHLADRTSEALKAITEAEALAASSGDRRWCAELHRLRAVFLAALGAEESQIEVSFREAVRSAREQKAVSLQKRADASYAEYRSQKTRALGGRGLRPEKISVARLPVTGSDVFGRERISLSWMMPGLMSV